MDTVLLLGMGPTARSALESLAARFRVAGLVRHVSSPDDDDDVGMCAHALRVTVFREHSVGGVKRVTLDTQPACTVSSSYDRILPNRVLSHCPFVNVHYAALPEYRGRANVNWAIINGEPETAITIHAIAPGLDDGNILFQQVVAIGPDDTATDIYHTLNEIQRDVLGETVTRYLDG